MNNLTLMKSIKENTQIEEAIINGRMIEVYIKGSDDVLEFPKDDYYEFLKDDGFVKDYEGNEDSQQAEYEAFDIRGPHNNFDSVFHFILDEVETIERCKRLARAKLPNLTAAFESLKSLLKPEIAA